MPIPVNKLLSCQALMAIRRSRDLAARADTALRAAPVAGVAEAIVPVAAGAAVKDAVPAAARAGNRGCAHEAPRAREGR